MHNLCVNKQCLFHSSSAPPSDIYADVQYNADKDVMHTSILTSACGGKNNTPDYKIFADKFDEDTGRMEGQGQGAEERRELTGTSFQYQRVGHCQRGEGGRNRERPGNGEQEHKRTITSTVEELDKQEKGL